MNAAVTSETDEPLVNKPQVPSVIVHEDSSATPSVTVGRAPDGRVFEVPKTNDMISSLFNPFVKHTLIDWIVLAFLGSYVALYFLLNGSVRQYTFLALFAFWRLSYNAGIGYLLHVQSKNARLVKWARDFGVFDDKTAIHKLVKHELTAKMGTDYKFENMPDEFNTWLIFRILVDLILCSDFTTYFLFGLTCYNTLDSPVYLVLFRWLIGIGLLVFNLWVKVDAHRVVKDYAWYWGDFFFLEDLELTFDGVFEMAPHPMYSVGYAGYYGGCIITASYKLLFASLLAHAAQFVFLTLVENPHIEKTYNPSPPHKRLNSTANMDNIAAKSSSTSLNTENDLVPDVSEDSDAFPAMVAFFNFHVYRVSDVFTVLLAVYSLFPLLLPSHRIYDYFATSLSLAWILFNCIGLGIILRKQSESQSWTKLFVKYGRTPVQAFEEWKSVYNLCNVLTYTSFLVVVLRELDWPPRTENGFRYVSGLMLIALHLWVSTSIYDSLGQFGWFFGDFFLPSNSSLTYSGIYRYFNNPGRVLGTAGLWGAVLMTNSRTVFLLSAIHTFGGIGFLKFVETPHMRLLYGDQLRKEAGVVKNLKRAARLPDPFEKKVRDIQGSIDKVFSETTAAVEEFLAGAGPRLGGNVTNLKSASKVLLSKYPAKLIITRVSDELQGIDPGQYSIEVSAKSGKKSSDDGVLEVTIGDPIVVNWTSSPNRSLKDWIGLYKVGANGSTLASNVSSKGRWSAISSEAYEDHTAGVIESYSDHGEVEFRGDALFWEAGTYEFRYHHDGRHNVMAISQPFRIVLNKVECDDFETIEKTLFPMIQKCFETSGTVEAKGAEMRPGTSIPPRNADDDLWDENLDEEQIMKRVGFCIKEMYGIEFAVQVIASEKSAKSLAMRIAKTKHALKPFTVHSAQ
ncbi:hypothetical protein CANCADRAFT_130659 [Tortispora caseinolytica NRRL Y-17796]|uniref:Phosphatidylethanolamine N-methyltransferase n=1 Tax=Tortispora caseinolytica NRRL Y-17796 TaxID=767744 RepID=A0A1E4TB26_9ASCO|nr:hypothetical protein CANCADRAFT_130659 [Tortispora caseinolytica NRRL Y-17796]